MPYPIPPDEAERNRAVRAYRIMDTPPEIAFDEIGELAARLCDCPVAYVSFIEEDRFFFKARYGIAEEMPMTCPREIAFCQVTICGVELVISPDLAADPRFRDFHFVVNEPHFRFYCSVPLVTPEGHALGTVCVMDFRPRELSFEQQESLRRLAQQLVGLLEHRRRLIELEAAHRAAEAEKARSDALLRRILPDRVASELMESGRVVPRFFPSATILFADIRGFTGLSEKLEPAMLVELLDSYFTGFDEVMERAGLEKLKTVGDAYLAVAGVPEPVPDHVERACRAALDMQAMVAALRSRREKLRLPFLDLRIGLHTGPVIAGIVGRLRFTYDIWGDAVNIAAAMESNGEPGRINVSERVRQHLAGRYSFVPRGSIDVKSKSKMEMYFLDGPLPPDEAFPRPAQVQPDDLDTERTPAA